MNLRLATTYIFFLGIFLPLLSYSQYMEDRIVVAQYGEGIYSILERNEMEPSRYLAAFIEINKQKMGKDSSLIAGNTYLLPEEIKPTIAEQKELDANPVKNPNNIYFGKEQNVLSLKDNSLKGAVYYLVSGHGGPDPGAIGNYNGQLISEDEYAYDVTLRLAKNLLEHGAEVFMIVHDEDDGIRNETVLKMDNHEKTYPDLTMPLNQRLRLKQRAESVNALYHQNLNKYQRLIVIHIDSRSEGENIDVFFYYHFKSERGEKLANEIQRVIRKKYAQHQPNRPYHGTVTSRSNLYMVKNTLPPMVYIELGNLQNPKDQRRFLYSDNRQALANWVAEGIINDHQNTAKK